MHVYFERESERDRERGSERDQEGVRDRERETHRQSHRDVEEQTKGQQHTAALCSVKTHTRAQEDRMHGFAWK